MAKKNRKPSKKALKRSQKKAKRPSRPETAKPRPSRPSQPKSALPGRQHISAPVTEIVQSSKEGTGFKIAIDRIDGDTIIGDLLVVFPRTREVLRKQGLRLDVEDAGDIYMTLEAFAALKGLKMETLVQELVQASKEAPTQPQPLPALVTPPTV